MKFTDSFLNLFHRQHQYTPNYDRISKFKKFLFVSAIGFISVLSFSKFCYTNLQFAFQQNQRNKYLVKLNTCLQRGTYTPSLPFVFGIFQRLFARYGEEVPYIRMEEESIQGQQLYKLNLHDKVIRSQIINLEQIPVVLVVAGSEGVDNTIKHMLNSLNMLCFRIIALDPKDHNDLSKFQSVCSQLKSKYPKSKYYGIGVEYGANLLINYASKYPQTFNALVSVGNPYDLMKSQTSLQQKWWWRQLYNNIWRSRMRKAGLKQQQFSQVQSLFQLDRHIHKIDEKDYIKWKIQNSSINNIVKIQVPTLLIQSKEDPFTQLIDDPRFENSNCIYVTTKRGGHNEWFQNLWMNRWVTLPIKNFVKIINSDKIQKMLNKS